MSLLPWPSWLHPGAVLACIIPLDEEHEGAEEEEWTCYSIGIVDGEQEFVVTRPNEVARWPLSLAEQLFRPMGGGAS